MKEYKDIKFEAIAIPQKGYDLTVKLYGVAPNSGIQDWIDATQNQQQFFYYFDGKNVEVIIKNIDGLKGNGETLEEFIRRVINSYITDKKVWETNYENRDRVGTKK